MPTRQLSPPPRVLLTKIGLDGHDRGSRIIVMYLRDAGMDVVYTPPWQSVEAVVATATQEDVDVIGISSLATDHLIVPDLMAALRKAGLGHVGVVVGGIVPESERPMLEQAGVSRVFGPGAARNDIVTAIADLATRSRRARDEAMGIDS